MFQDETRSVESDDLMGEVMERETDRLQAMFGGNASPSIRLDVNRSDSNTTGITSRTGMIL